MGRENNQQQGNEASNAIEDLTLKETEAENVKGGRSYIDTFSLTDLPVADEQAEEITGGARKNGSVILYDQTHTE